MLILFCQVYTASFLSVMNGHAQGKDTYFEFEQKVIFLIFYGFVN